MKSIGQAVFAMNGSKRNRGLGIGAFGRMVVIVLVAAASAHGETVLFDDFSDGNYTNNPTWTASHPDYTSVTGSLTLRLGLGDNQTVQTSFVLPGHTLTNITLSLDTLNHVINEGYMASFYLVDSVSGQRVGILGSGVNNMSHNWGLQLAGNGMNASGGSSFTYGNSWVNWRFDIDPQSQTMKVYRNGNLMTWRVGGTGSAEFTTVALHTTKFDTVLFQYVFGTTARGLYFDNVQVSVLPPSPPKGMVTIFR